MKKQHIKNNKQTTNNFKSLVTLLLMIGTVLFSASCNKSNPEPEPQLLPLAYSNNNLSIGLYAHDGTVAPAGHRWALMDRSSMHTVGYPPMGYAADFAEEQSVADDFTVPSGETWNIEHIYLYAYEEDFDGETFPMEAMYLEIYSGDPSKEGVTKVYGDYEANRYVSAEDTKLYRIGTGVSQLDTRRKIYQIKVKTEGLELEVGTYWFKFSGKLSSGNTLWCLQNPFDPTNGHMFNAMEQKTDGTWALLRHNSWGVDIPFEIEGKKWVR